MVEFLTQDAHVSFPLFGKTIDFIIYNSNLLLIQPIIEEIKIEALALEKIFNLFDKESELNRLNEKRDLVVSKHLLRVIKEALVFCELTSGAYDISLGQVFLARKKGPELPKINCSYKDIKINKNRIRLTHPDVFIDLGSIAKGYITDILAQKIKKLGIESCLINSRGDIRIFGSVTEEINIQNPRDKGKFIDSFELKNASVATSGDYNQYQGSFDNSHIINAGDLISITIISKDLMQADALATALFVSSQSLQEKIIKKYPKTKIFMVTQSQEVKKINWFE